MRFSFSIKLTLKTLYYNKKKVLIVVLGMIIALSFLFSTVIWEDTTENLVIDDFIDNVDYLASTSSFLSGTNHQIGNYLASDSLIDNVDIAIQTSALFNVGNKSDDYRYFPFNMQENMSDPIDIIDTGLYEMSIMDNLENVLEVDGRMPIASNEIMISSPIVGRLESLLNTTIVPGTTLDLAIVKRYPNTENGELTIEFFNMTKFENLEVVGIFNLNGAETLIDRSFNLEFFRRSIIFPLTLDNFNSGDIVSMDRNLIIADFLLEFNREIFYEIGIDKLDQVILTLFERIKSRYFFATFELLDDEIKSLQNEFSFAFNSTLLYYPLITLSLLLSFFALEQLIRTRSEEIEILRLQGATDREISLMFFKELLVIALGSVLIGIPISIVTATLIPSINSDKLINFSKMKIFYQNLDLNYVELYEISLIIIGLFLITGIYQILNSIYIIQFGENYFNIQRIIVILITTGVIIAFYFDYQQFSKYFGLRPLSFPSNLADLLKNTIILLMILWVVISLFLSDLTQFFLTKLSKIHSYIIPTNSFYVTKSLKRPKLKNKILIFYIIFLFSILIFSISILGTYNVYENESDYFLQGADFRIHTSNTESNFTEIINKIEGIEIATPIYSTTILVGSQHNTLYAVDPSTYLSVGRWEFSNGSGAPETLLSTLRSDSAQLLFSQRLYQNLNFDLNESVNLNSIDGTYIHPWNISGVIESAPGLGLSSYSNAELSQTTNGWVVTNLAYYEATFNIKDVVLFLASLREGYEYNQVLSDLEKLDEVIIVNPQPINQNFIGVFISEYLPTPQLILQFVLFLTGILSIILIGLTTSYLLKERKIEFNLLIAIGGSRSRVFKLIYYEFMVTSIFATIVGTIFGITISRFSLQFFIPFTMRKVFVPIKFIINPIPIILMIIGFLSVIQLIILYNRRKIIPKYGVSIILEG